MEREICGNVETPECPWYNSKNKIISVVINDGVTNIAEEAFSNCSRLTSVTIPKSVTTIGKRAFYNCQSLSSVEMESGVDIIDEEAFSRCSDLRSITIPKSVTTIGKRAFYNCQSLSSVEMKSGVDIIGEEAFSRCSDLRRITIPESVTNIGTKAFYGCGSLELALINAKNIGDLAFGGCNVLRIIEIGKNVENISINAFDECRHLEKIHVSPDNQNYSNIDGVLLNKEKTIIMKFPAGKDAISYTVPSGVTKIGDEAFKDCVRLEKIELPNGVTEIGENAFIGCTGLRTIRIPKTVTKIGDNAFKDCPIAKIVTDKDAKYVTEFAKTNSIDYTEDDFSANVSYSTTNLTNQNVTVIIDASAGITQLPNGWNYKESSENKSITKIYTENGTENVTIKNEKGTEIVLNISVNNIDKTAPVITKEINLASDKKSCYVKLTSNKEIQKVNRMDIVR